jgi:hypothetical protein
MKPRNFPGRKNDRRKGAFKRLRSDQIAEMKILLDRIVPDSVARGIRTKKDRTSRAKLART